ncbi:MAG: hypothetical protein B7Z73_06020 [Planctomycetia bacterium 21-64-5]|nr:MAG: hypothetical protein B7Z73_06020 [Planctomycetia bacterium 21-64-5]HQU43007.1 acylphosphatase [Pirellulales bacterium]
MSEHERREVHYSGRVQGVGFRYTTRELAQDFDVSGYVENLPDGRVQLVAEGEPAELDRFLDAVAERLRRYIGGIHVRTRPAGGDFSGFSVRH